MLLSKHEKETKDRKRNLMYLVLKFLQDEGYYPAFEALQKDTNLLLAEKVLDENLTLMSILKDYEDYFEIRYGKRPKFTSSANPVLPVYKKATLPAMPKPSVIPPPESQNSNPNLLQKPQQKKQLPTVPTPSMASLDLQITGTNVTSATPAPSTNPSAPTIKDKIPASGLPSSVFHTEDALAFARSLLPSMNVAPAGTPEAMVGLKEATESLSEAITLPLSHPELFASLLTPAKGALLFGPPGTGKTLLAKHISSQFGLAFFNITASSIVSKFHGESEKMVKCLFDLARLHSPAIIFIDEIDSIMTKRTSGDIGSHEASRRLKTELLVQMDGLASSPGVFLLAASNTPWDLDLAFLRRLEKRVRLSDLHSPARSRRTTKTFRGQL